MRRNRVILQLTVALLLATRVAAQTAAVQGIARADDNDVPIAFALVRLVPADSTASPSRNAPQTITNAAGRFRFAGIAAGDYRVQLLRIGYRPELSAPVHVAAGETAEVPLRVIAQPLQLPVVTVRAKECVSLNALAKHDDLAVLWQQGRGAALIHEGLMEHYRFRTITFEKGFERRSDGSTPGGQRVDTAISNPKFALSDAARRRAQRLSRGYAGPNDGWYLPNELDVLHEDFLRSHCIDPDVERGDGEVGVHFRPTRTRRGFRDVRVTLWLDSASFLTRRLELEYVEDNEARGTVRVDYGDIVVDGAMLRMPVRATYLMRPSKKNPDKLTEGTVTFSYGDFEETRQR